MAGLFTSRWARRRAAADDWAAGAGEAALDRCLQALDTDPAPNPDGFIQPGFYAFQLERFDIATAVLECGRDKFPTHPMILLSLGCSYSRWRKPARAIPLLERLLALGSSTHRPMTRLPCPARQSATRSARAGSGQWYSTQKTR